MSNFIRFWRNKLNTYLAHGIPAGERQLLSRFQAVSAREATVMMTAALVLGSAAGILSVGLNWTVHGLREFSQTLDVGWMVIVFPALGAGIAVFMIRSRMKDFSGHGVSIAGSAGAVALGAIVVEKHVTLNKKMLGSDHAASR